MTWLYILLCLLAALLALFLVKIKLKICGKNNSWRIYIGALGFSFRLYPPKENKKPKKPKKPGAEKKEKSAPETGDAKDVLMLILKDLRRHLGTFTVDKLELKLIVATSDAAQTALAYGAANTAAGIIITYAETLFKIRKKSVRITADFDKSETEIEGTIIISTNLTRAISLIKYFMTNFTKDKKGDNNG